MRGLIDSLDYIGLLPIASWKIVTSSEDLLIYKFPYFLKADISGHKTELGAVMKCNNLEEANKNLIKLNKNFPKNSILVQETFEGIEMIVGLKEDKVFGKLLVVGFGGIFAELKKDVSFRALPVGRREVVAMVQELKGVELFNARGKKYNLEKFYTLIEKVAYLGEKKNILELDLNPVIVGEKECKIVDARLRLD